MIIVGSKDIGPIKFILNYIKDINNICWIRTNKNKRYIKDYKSITSYKNKRPKLVITGTSIGPGLDKNLLIFAKKNKIKSISFIEHWSFLKERFLIEKGKFIFPDYLFVINKKIKNYLVKNLSFKEKNIFVIGNAYLANLKKRNFKKKNNSSILFISQPHKKLQNKLFRLFSIKNYFGFNEYDVIKKLIHLNKGEKYKISIKLHPNEKINKFSFLDKNKVKIYYNLSKEKILQKYDYIIGMDSMLLLELYIMGGNVISYRPNAKNRFYGNYMKIFPILSNLNNINDIENLRLKNKKLIFKKTKIKNKINHILR